MNVRISLVGFPNRTDLYTSVERVQMNDDEIALTFTIGRDPGWNPLILYRPAIGNIAIDSDGAVT
jgi:hypothetical protein